MHAFLPLLRRGPKKKKERIASVGRGTAPKEKRRGKRKTRTPALRTLSASYGRKGKRSVIGPISKKDRGLGEEERGERKPRNASGPPKREGKEGNMSGS